MGLGRDGILVIFDGACGFCTGVVHKLERVDWRHKLTCLPLQTPGLPEAVGTTKEEAEKAVMALSPAGRLWVAGGAMAAIFDALLPRGLPVFRTIYEIPGLHRLIDKLYYAVAERRSKLPGEAPAVPKGTAAGSLDPAIAEELERRRLASRMPSAMPGPGLMVH